jgi:6-phosphofructokinase 1
LNGLMKFANPLHLRRVAILFSGGPAPGANAVISTAATSFLRQHISVVGVLNGYSNLVEYHPERPLVEGRDYVMIDQKMLRRTRNLRGIILGTARTNPGALVERYDDLKDSEKVRPLRVVYEALESLDVDALISIGGDDTLKTANKFARFQREQLPEGHRRIAVVHIPKTIDNDYAGIDYTFGYFTAVETLASEIRNLLADAEATRSYYIAETMGRYAGWLAYGAAMAGEASLVLSVEDVVGDLLDHEDTPDEKRGGTFRRKIVNFDRLMDRLVAVIEQRRKEGKPFGVFVLAEGLAEYLPYEYIKGVPRDEHGHLSIANVNFARIFSKLLAERCEKRFGKKPKITGVQLGYEARCAPPQAFDVMLGSALGVGAFRALVEHGLDEVMVSTMGQMALRFVPFADLINPETMMTQTRYIEYGSDFHKLARFLETYVV